MKLEYTSADKTAIKATLTSNNYLGGIQGPVEIVVPAISGNKEYDDIIARNLTVKNYVAPVIIPDGVSPLQARKALRQAGVYDTFKTMMDVADEETQEEWEYCTVVLRTNPLIAQFGTALGFTEKQLDDLFILAATL